MIAIVTESTADLSASQLGYSGVHTIPVPVTLGGQPLDERQLTPEQLIRMVEQTGQPALSLPIRLDDCFNVYEQALQRASSIVHVITSPGLDGHAAVAQQAAQAFGQRVSIVDSGMVSYSMGLQAMHAAYLADQQATPEHIRLALQDMQRQLISIFTVERLDFLRINGRIGSFGALVGNLLGLHPILAMENGQLVSKGNPRGPAAAQVLAQQVANFTQRLGRSVQIHFTHTVDGEAQADRLRGAVTGMLPSARVSPHVQPLGVVVNANGGRGVAGLVAFPETISFPRGVVF